MDQRWHHEGHPWLSHHQSHTAAVSTPGIPLLHLRFNIYVRAATRRWRCTSVPLSTLLSVQVIWRRFSLEYSGIMPIYTNSFYLLLFVVLVFILSRACLAACRSIERSCASDWDPGGQDVLLPQATGLLDGLPKAICRRAGQSTDAEQYQTQLKGKFWFLRLLMSSTRDPSDHIAILDKASRHGHSNPCSTNIYILRIQEATGMMRPLWLERGAIHPHIC